MPDGSVDIASLLAASAGAPQVSAATIPPPDTDTSTGATKQATAGKLPSSDITAIVSSAFNDMTNKLGITANAGTALIQAGKVAGAAQAQAQQGVASGAAAQQTINTTEEMARIKLRTDILSAMSSASINPADKNNLYTSIGQTMAARQQDILSGQKELEDRSKVGFFDNPGEWLVNQFVLPTMREHVNTQIASQKQDAEYLSDAQALATSEGKLLTATDTADSVEHLKAVNALTIATAQRDSAAIGDKYAGFLTSFASVRNAVDMDSFMKGVQLHNMNVEDQRLQLEKVASGIAEKRLEIDETYKKLQMQMRQDQIDVKDRVAGAVQQIQGKIDATTTALGMPKMTYDEFDKLSGKYKDDMSRAIAYFSDPTGKAISPARTLGIVNDLNAPLTPGANITRTQLMDVLAPVRAGVTFSQMKPEAQIAQEDAVVAGWVKQQGQMINPTGNIFSPPPLSSVLDMPSLASMPMVAALKPFVTSNTTPTDFDTISQVAISQVRAGKESPASAAAQIVKMYSAINQDLAVTKQFTKFGINVVGDSTGYRVPVTQGEDWQSRTSVNVLNQAEVEATLTRIVAEAGYYDQASTLVRGANVGIHALLSSATTPFPGTPGQQKAIAGVLNKVPDYVNKAMTGQ